MNDFPMTARIEIGASVRVEHQFDRDRLYVETARRHRQLCNGLTGVAISEHDGHGLCYQVKFPSGVVVTFDREELTVMPSPAAEERKP
jgi:hypothetical protein